MSHSRHQCTLCASYGAGAKQSFMPSIASDAFTAARRECIPFQSRM
jgi:hypothetical protein